MKSFDIIKEIHINLNVLATFLYMISFVGLISKTDNIKDMTSIVAFSIISIYLLYKANEATHMYIICGIYLILSFFKLQTLSNTKNKKILKSIWSIILIIFMLNIFSYNYKWSNVPGYSKQLQERVTESKMIGKMELKEDTYLEYIYTNFSYYSFVYLVENYGKICGIFIVSVLMFLFVKLVFNYQQTKDNYGKMLNIGIGCFLFIPTIMNFLTRVGVTNFQSVNIPFITHNDINIIVYMISISLIMSIYSKKNINVISLKKIQNNA